MSRQFGKFQLLRKIATGGMADIFIARQRGMEGFEKIVVIKTILPNLADNEEFVQMFLDEARIAARLSHPNIVQIFDLGRVGSTFFIAMEYVQGENLRSLAKACQKQDRTIPLQHTVRIISKACEGLHYAHMKTDTSGRPMDIVHRDISPQNILISIEGGVKLVDFGIAKAATQYRETRTGILKGKYSYMSPEQCSGTPVDARSDIFSMGIVLWEMATGLRLFNLDSELMILKEITEGSVMPPREVNKAIPAELEAIIIRALERHTGNRFQTAAEMHIALEEFSKERQMASSSIQLGNFMQDMFREKLQAIKKHDEAQATSQSLESFLFSDIDAGPDMYIPEADASASGHSPATHPFQPAVGVSHVPNLVLDPMEMVPSVARPSTPPPPAAPLQSPTLPIPKQAPPEVEMPRSRVWPKVALVAFLSGIFGYLILLFIQQTGEPEPQLSDAGLPVVVEKGSIRVSSIPAGATVFLDGNRKGTTPLSLADLEQAKSYALRLTQSGYREWGTQFKLEDDSERTFHARLEKTARSNFGQVSVITTPAGATVTLDGRPVPGTTPLTLKKVSSQSEHTLVASYPGRQDWTKTFRVRTNKKLELNASLKKKAPDTASPSHKLARYTLRSRPKGAKFTLNNKPVSGNIKIDAGRSYVLKARLPGYKEWRDELFPEAGEQEIIVAKLLKTNTATVNSGKSYLSLNCTPWADVYLNGRKIGTTPFTRQEIRPGSHTLRLVNKQLLATKIIKIDAVAGGVIKRNVAFGKGYLQVNAKPWAHVHVHGEQLGTTPFQPKELYEGSYTIVLSNPPLNQTIERKVQIKTGEKSLITVDFLE